MGWAWEVEEGSQLLAGAQLELPGDLQQGPSPFPVYLLLLENEGSKDVSFRGVCQEEVR